MRLPCKKGQEKFGYNEKATTFAPAFRERDRQKETKGDSFEKKYPVGFGS
jgi:hypothetical protein